MIRKRVLVTGGAGFVGSHLCERLLADGHEVVCLDNFFTGTHANVAHLREHPRFELFRHDVQEALTMEVDQIFHLACPASPIHYQRNPVRTIRTAVQGTLNLLDVAREASARMLIASTSEVYGDPAEHPQTESYWGNVNPIGLRGCYDESKRFAEALTMAYHREHGVETRIVRIFNTYGPRMRLRDGRVVPAFISQALLNRPVPVFGRGEQTRSFCYCSDLIDGIYRLMQSQCSEPVNIGNPAELTVLQFAREIIAATGSRSKILYRPLPEDDPRQRRPDITRARKLLGWEPRVALAEGLVKTISYFRGRLGLGGGNASVMDGRARTPCAPREA